MDPPQFLEEIQKSGILAGSFEELAEKALANIRGMQGLSMVCGPITTGGTGNHIHNFEIFNAALRGLQWRGKIVFNQLPYEFGISKLTKKWLAEGNQGYCMPILTVFYERILSSGAISDSWFIPGWRSSFGASWERNKLAELGHQAHDLTHADIREFLEGMNYPSDHVAVLMSQLAQ